MKDTIVTYEHMLNCAQPHQKPKVIVVRDIEEQEDVEDKEDSKTDILSFWRKKRASKGKNLSFNDERSPQTQNAKKAKGDVSVKDNKKKYRKRTTILPLYLKKIQNNAAIKEKITDSNPPHETKLETELSNTRKRIAITKSEYRYRQGEKPQDVQKLLKEKVLSADHQNEAISRIKPNSKYSEGSEEDRHWYQNSKASSKFDAGCREIKDFNPGKKN